MAFESSWWDKCAYACANALVNVQMRGQNNIHYSNAHVQTHKHTHTHKHINTQMNPRILENTSLLGTMIFSSKSHYYWELLSTYVIGKFWKHMTIGNCVFFHQFAIIIRNCVLILENTWLLGTVCFFLNLPLLLGISMCFKKRMNNGNCVCWFIWNLKNTV